MRPDKIEIFKDVRGEWRWRRRAGNGQIIETSGEGYTRKWSARRAVRRAFR